MSSIHFFTFPPEANDTQLYCPDAECVWEGHTFKTMEYALGYERLAKCSTDPGRARFLIGLAPSMPASDIRRLVTGKAKDVHLKDFHLVDDTWAEHATECITALLTQHASTSETFRQTVVATGEQDIVFYQKAIATDAKRLSVFAGGKIGDEVVGQNILGRALMQLRDHIQNTPLKEGSSPSVPMETVPTKPTPPAKRQRQSIRVAYVNGSGVLCPVQLISILTTTGDTDEILVRQLPLPPSQDLDALWIKPEDIPYFNLRSQIYHESFFPSTSDKWHNTSGSLVLELGDMTSLVAAQRQNFVDSLIDPLINKGLLDKTALMVFPEPSPIAV